MDPDLGIGPVEHGLPAQEVGIFHIRKRTLDLRLTAIGEDNLLALQFRAEGDHQGAFLPPDLTRDAPGPSWFEARIFELLKFLDRESQQFGEVGGYQRTNEMEMASVQNLLIGGGVVALIKDQGDGPAMAGQNLVSLGEFLQGLGKSDAVKLIVRIDLPQ